MADRTLTEEHRYSHSDLAEIAKAAAKLSIVNSYYVGDFHEQTAEWSADGKTLIVKTRHTPSSFR